MHFDEEMGFQFLCPRSTVLPPSDPSPPTVGVQKSACILSRSRGNGTKRHTNLDMSLVTQWKEVTFLATFFGLHGQQNNPSGALMPGKVIGCGWTNVLTWLCWELNTSLMPFASTHKGPGGQPQSKLWASLPAVYQRMPIWRTCM